MVAENDHRNTPAEEILPPGRATGRHAGPPGGNPSCASGATYASRAPHVTAPSWPAPAQVGGRHRGVSALFVAVPWALTAMVPHPEAHPQHVSSSTGQVEAGHSPAGAPAAAEVPSPPDTSPADTAAPGPGKAKGKAKKSPAAAEAER